MKRKLDTITIVKAAFLTAISVVLTRFLAIMLTPEIRISIGPVPIMLAGIAYGPLVGGAVGLVADIIGVLINPQGTPHLGFTLSSILTGVIPGLIAIYGNKLGMKTLLHSAISVFLVIFIIHIGLNSYWLSMLFGKSFMVTMPARIVKSLVIGIACYLVLAVILAADEKRKFL